MTSQPLIVHTVIVSDGSEKKHRGKYEKARGLSAKSELESERYKEPCEAQSEAEQSEAKQSETKMQAHNPHQTRHECNAHNSHVRRFCFSMGQALP